MNRYMRYRGLFAVELALLPLIIAFNLLIDTWAVSIPLLMLAVCRGIMIFIKDPTKTSDHIIEVVGDCAILEFLAIYFCALGYIPVWLTIVDCILVPLFQLANVYFYNKPLPDIIEALDFCFLAFLFTTIISLSFVMVFDVVAKVSFIALMLTCGICVAYKLYRFLRYYVIEKVGKYTKERAKEEKKKSKQ